ncbi:protein ecdysoneless homolog, partial [Eriocheir sinensis]|uniref:protein ecdysoneless homolog n=1 Tax=Eriocheir sinensis TaxID=95602 RepID=UPI0021C8EF76
PEHTCWTTCNQGQVFGGCEGKKRSQVTQVSNKRERRREKREKCEETEEEKRHIKKIETCVEEKKKREQERKKRGVCAGEKKEKEVFVEVKKRETNTEDKEVCVEEKKKREEAEKKKTKVCVQKRNRETKTEQKEVLVEEHHRRAVCEENSQACEEPQQSWQDQAWRITVVCVLAGCVEAKGYRTAEQQQLTGPHTSSSPPPPRTPPPLAPPSHTPPPPHSPPGVIDSDGEYLLVEAADHLPPWANPETASQRVYLYGGKVHLIPVAESPASLSPLPRGTPTVAHAVSTVNRLPEMTLAPPAVQGAITDRLSGYPGRISKEQHVAHAYVPVGVAALLREYPTLLGPAVHAFCSRDALDNKVLRVMRHFPPETRVTTAVRFSKALYAQLAAHRYTPDPRVGWDLPLLTNQGYKVHDIGMKLACGFEILVCSAGGVTPTTPTTTSAPTQPHAAPDPRWLRYHKALMEKGYYRGELEGSQLYKALEDNARQYFESHVVSGQASQDGEDLTVGAMVVKLLSKVNMDHEFYKERSTRLIPADDDSWLQITPDALDDLLESKYGKQGVPRGATEKEMMDSLSAFMGHMSDVDGAEVPQRKMSTLSTPKRKGGKKLSTSLLGQHHLRKVSAQSNASDVSNCSEMSSFSNKVDFNAEAFSDAMANILESGVPEDDYWCGSDDDSSGMSSYEGEEGADVSLSRKSSNTSSTSSSSSTSKGNQMRQYMKQMEEELAGTKIADTLTPAPAPSAAPATSSEDEFDDVEDFCPVKVDLKAVQDLVKTYSAQNGLPGPASSLLGSVGMKPKNT